jgi:hypothetical protein
VTSPAAYHDELDAAIAALDPEKTESAWRLEISSDLEFTLSQLVETWPTLREDDDLLAAVRMLLRRDPSTGRIASQPAVHIACVALLGAILNVHAEDGGDCLTYGAVLNLDSALAGLTAAVGDLKAELGRRAAA